MAERHLYQGERVQGILDPASSMGILAHAIPFFLAQKSECICPEGSINFSGALLMQRNLQLYRETIEGFDHSPQLIMRAPIEVSFYEIQNKEKYFLRPPYCANGHME